MRINFQKWKLPTNYGVVINEILAKKGTLSEPNLSAICRRIVDSIEEITLCPCGDSLRIVVHHLFERFPSTQIDKKDRVSSSVLFNKFCCTNLKHCMHFKCLFPESHCGQTSKDSITS